MVSPILPSPPPEDVNSGSGLGSSGKYTSSSSKSTKHINHVSRRAGSGAFAARHHGYVAYNAGRVWMACERCRIRRPSFPCRRCKDDSLVCIVGGRKKIEGKLLPRGYAEVQENTQFALIATVRTLYSMVRNSQPWDLGEPDLNNRGLPAIRDIAQKLGCIRPNTGIDMPVSSVFPEDETGTAELARQLGDRSRKNRGDRRHVEGSDSPNYERNGILLSSDLVHTGYEANGRGSDFDFSSTAQEMDPSVMFASTTPPLPIFSTWTMPKPQSNSHGSHFPHHGEGLQNVHILNQGMAGSQFDVISCDIMSYQNPDRMMGLSNLTTYMLNSQQGEG